LEYSGRGKGEVGFEEYPIRKWCQTCIKNTDQIWAKKKKLESNSHVLLNSTRESRSEMEDVRRMTRCMHSH
jgi:hypothetical protein